MGKFMLFLTYVVLLVVLLGLVDMVFELHRFAFILQFFFLLGILFVTLISVLGVNNNFKWAWKLLKLVFLFAFLDMAFMHFVFGANGDLFFHFVGATVVGFFLCLFSILGHVEEEDDEPEEEVMSNFDPGKFISSKAGKTYHTPDCDWAKKIQEKNVVWFDDKEEAKKAGQKPHSCVE